MQRQLDDLDGGVVADLDVHVGRQRDLRQAHGAGEGVLGGADDLEGGNHGEAHVGGTVVGAFSAETHVDVDEGSRVALEPAWLEGDRAACYGPEGAVRCQGDAAAWRGVLVRGAGEGDVVVTDMDTSIACHRESPRL